MSKKYRYISFDADIVHGKHPDFSYLRHKENTEVLGILKPYLTQAFEVRKDRHEQVITGLKTIIALAQKLVYLLRMQRKDGVPKTDY